MKCIKQTLGHYYIPVQKLLKGDGMPVFKFHKQTFLIFNQQKQVALSKEYKSQVKQLIEINIIDISKGDICQQSEGSP
ncbi:hypothetical protein BF17_01695 [Yersinia similis]|uniref:Uncharacterized protein n=2 Tax=Yersinia similis TaxID=367190 RepID=A0ABM5PUL1_9GAMM|nr:hypothetical protein BF17_01695 [Yersinia similis]